MYNGTFSTYLLFARFPRIFCIINRVSRIEDYPCTIFFKSYLISFPVFVDLRSYECQREYKNGYRYKVFFFFLHMHYIILYCIMSLGWIEIVTELGLQLLT